MEAAIGDRGASERAIGDRLESGRVISDRVESGRVISDRVESGRAISDRALSKLRWRCRRGLLENDLLIERFFTRRAAITQADANGLTLLMELADNDLLDLFLGRQKPTANLDRPEVHQVLEAVRAQGTRPDRSPSVILSRTTP
jgi:antitoxin CptB